MDHLVYYVCLPCTYVKFCVCDSFTFGFDGRMWVLIVSGHCPPVFLRRMSHIENKSLRKHRLRWSVINSG